AIKKFACLDVNLIAGGLITTKKEVQNALEAGAIAVSTSSSEIFG
ncbi:MAG: glycerol-3-phosphate responsive antiterminator, partial [Clostridia bacterium]|nr:glycerol-3-phosphate responsive antiterminator [Clostridia bacterium]